MDHQLVRRTIELVELVESCVRVQCVIQQGTDRSMRTVHAPTRRRRSSKPCMWLQAHHHPWGLAVGCPVATCCSCAGPVRACACVRAWMPIHLTPRPRTTTTPCWCRRRSARAVAAARNIDTYIQLASDPNFQR
jgi:hypothetical protein